jgi:primosomal protein N' (replication factor Y) (superfamily II helicase)
VPAAELPVARVCVDVPLAHLDRPFDYLVPADLADDVSPGCRVRVRFAGRQVDGFVLDRVAESGHDGRLEFLTRLVSPVPVLAPEVAALARAVADRYAGRLFDVLRLAVPPRHAKVESEPAAGTVPAGPDRPSAQGWARYPRGPAFLQALASGRAAHAVWQAAPGEDWPARLAEAAATTASCGRGAIVVLPDHRDVDRVHAACASLLGDAAVALTADLGPARRYRRWLAVRRGEASVVVGTRAAMFAPVHDPGLLVVWDDGDDLHAEQRAPYPHVREVLMQRAHTGGAALLCAGFARTAEAQLLVDTGWAHEVVAPRAMVRECAPRIGAISDDGREQARDQAARTARLPLVAVDAARAALTAGAPVLVQVPRGGYVPTLACGQCRTPARCRRCAGPLGLPGSAPGARPAGSAAGAPACRWCGVTEAAYVCPTCGSRRLRAVVVGAGRTAEELGRTFSGVPVRTSGGAEVLATVPGGPALVVCTPGAEPVADGGYGAALLMDGWALLARPDLRAGEEALRRWLAAAALVRPAAAGGRVVVMADSTLPVVQALVRWDPAWHAATELAARTELGFPPAMRLATVDGSPDAVQDLLDAARLPASAQLLGPVPLPPAPTGPGTTGSGPAGRGPEDAGERERMLVRVPRVDGRAMAAALAQAQAVRSARKATDPVRVRLDPVELA